MTVRDRLEIQNSISTAQQSFVEYTGQDSRSESGDKMMEKPERKERKMQRSGLSGY